MFAPPPNIFIGGRLPPSPPPPPPPPRIDASGAEAYIYPELRPGSRALEALGF